MDSENTPQAPEDRPEPMTTDDAIDHVISEQGYVDEDATEQPQDFEAGALHSRAPGTEDPAPTDEHLHSAEPPIQAPPPPPGDMFAEAQRELDGARGHMNAMISATNWAELRESDPAEFAAKMMDRTAAEQTLNQRQHELDTARQQQVYREQAQLSHRQQTVLARERDSLLNAIPAWRDPAVRVEQSRQLRDWALSEGYSAEDLAGLSDHRMVKTLHKAWRADTAPARNTDALRDKLRAHKTKGRTRRKEDSLSSEVQRYLGESRTKLWSGDGAMSTDQAVAHVLQNTYGDGE